MEADISESVASQSSVSPVVNNDDVTSQDLLKTKQVRKQLIEEFIKKHDLTEKGKIKWREDVKYITPTTIQWAQKAQPNLTNLKSPVDYFYKYFDDTLFDTMVTYTNLYHLQNNTRFENTNIKEIKKFVGIHIIMGNLSYPRIRLYWDSKLCVNVVKNNMPYNRFSKLRTHIHFTDANQPNETDKFWKVRVLYDKIRHRCMQLSLETNLSIDEQIIPFKGQLSVKQYIKGKPCPWGIKLYALCGSSGLLYDFILYQGPTTEINSLHQQVFGQSAAVVIKLTERITNPNHQLYFDNYFSNYQLLQWLQNRYIYASCTARADRFAKPPLLSDKQIAKKERGFSQEIISADGQVIMTRWLDNKCVTMASNFQSKGEEDTCKRWSKIEKKYLMLPRPEVIKQYNASMGGVDKLDFLISLYRTFIRSKKWTLRMFTHALDLACCNAWLEYREEAKFLNIAQKDTFDLFHFRLYIAEELIYSGQTVKKPGRPSSTDNSPHSSPTPSKKRCQEYRPIKEIRLDGIGHFPDFDDKPTHSQTRCKFPNCAGKTHIFCKKCKIHLCIQKKIVSYCTTQSNVNKFK